LKNKISEAKFEFSIIISLKNFIKNFFLQEERRLSLVFFIEISKKSFGKVQYKISSKISKERNTKIAVVNREKNSKQIEKKF